MTEHYVTQWRPDKGVWVLTAVSKLRESEDRTADRDRQQREPVASLEAALDLCLRG